MKVIEQKKVATEIIMDIRCNKCGKSCKVYIDMKAKYFNFEYAALLTNFGYGSGLDSMRFDEIHLCEKCFKKFIGSCKIKPKCYFV